MGAIETWNEEQKIEVILAVGEGGYNFDFEMDSPDDFEVDIYHVDDFEELAEQFIDEGYFLEIPDHMKRYIDRSILAHELSMDYVETTVAGKRPAN